MKKGKYNLWKKMKNKKDWIPAICIYFLMILVILIISPEKLSDWGQMVSKNYLNENYNPLIQMTFLLSIYFFNGYYVGLIGIIFVIIFTPLRSYCKISIISFFVFLITSGTFIHYQSIKSIFDLFNQFFMLFMITIGRLYILLIPILIIYGFKKMYNLRSLNLK